MTLSGMNAHPTWTNPDGRCMDIDMQQDSFREQEHCWFIPSRYNAVQYTFPKSGALHDLLRPILRREKLNPFALEWSRD